MSNQVLDDVFRSEESKAILIQATKGKRLINMVVDRVAAYFLFYLFIMMIDLLGLEYTGLILLVVPLLFGYYVLMEYFANGKTIGKMLTGTRVTTEYGFPPSIGSIIGRTFARLIPFEQFSFLGSGYQGWHDSLSHTIVIDDRQSRLPSEVSKLV